MVQMSKRGEYLCLDIEKRLKIVLKDNMSLEHACTIGLETAHELATCGLYPVFSIHFVCFRTIVSFDIHDSLKTSVFCYAYSSFMIPLPDENDLPYYHLNMLSIHPSTNILVVDI